MEGAVDDRDLLRVVARHAGEALMLRLHFGNVLNRATHRGPSMRRTLQQSERLKKLSHRGERHICDARPTIGQQLNKAFTRQPDQRLPYRRAGHPQIANQSALVDAHTRPEIEAENTLPQVLVCAPSAGSFALRCLTRHLKLPAWLTGQPCPYKLHTK